MHLVLFLLRSRALEHDPIRTLRLSENPARLIGCLMP